MKVIKFKKGLHEIKKSIYAYLQPDGSWGLNNAGLIVSKNKSLLIDTLFDLKLTGEMLNSINKITKKIDYLVNTHSSGDHYYGNQLVENAEIITTKLTAIEMIKITPQKMSGLMKFSWLMIGFGKYVRKCFGKFKFDDITPVNPDRTFEGKMNLKIGDKKVRLIEVFNTHTISDILVYLPDDKILFAGDIAFINVTPIMWQGPVINWINACNMILKMNVNTIIPGHGPITDKNGIKLVKEYFEYTYTEAKKRFDIGMSFYEAALDIDLKNFSSWKDPERIVTNVFIYYKEFIGDNTPLNSVKMFKYMSKYLKDKEKKIQ